MPMLLSSECVNAPIGKQFSLLCQPLPPSVSLSFKVQISQQLLAVTVSKDCWQDIRRCLSWVSKYRCLSTTSFAVLTKKPGLT